VLLIELDDIAIEACCTLWDMAAHESTARFLHSHDILVGQSANAADIIVLIWYRCYDVTVGG
jgi:hypothetical protein